jgi:hypothetical protein
LIIGIGWAVEEHALEVVADLLHFEKVDQVIVGSGAGEVPSSDERILLSRNGDTGRGQHNHDDGELRAHESIPFAGPGLRPSACRLSRLVRAVNRGEKKSSVGAEALVPGRVLAVHLRSRENERELRWTSFACWDVSSLACHP